MTTIQQLPYDILENIFRSVLGPSNQKRHLLQCAFVCQSWYLPVCRVLYEKITILSRARLINCLDIQRTNFGAFCREIELNDGTSLRKELLCEQYDLLFSYMPYLHTVIVGYRSIYADLNHLARNVNQIQHLKSLTIEPRNLLPSMVQSYYRCAFAYKQTIQHLKLTAPCLRITGNDGQKGYVYNFLSDFTSLTSLHIENSIGWGLRQLSMLHVLHLCPNLSKFIWINAFEEPDFDEDNCQFDHGSLKYLNISAPEFNVQHLEFIVKKLTGLMRLGLNVGPTFYKSSRDALDIDRFYEWQSNFSSAEKAYFIVYSKLEPSITQYWLFMDGINSNYPSTSVHITIVVPLQYTREEETSKIKLYTHEKRIFYHCEIDTNELNSWESDVSSNSLQSPLIPTNLSCKSIVQSYEVKCTPSSNKEDQMVHDLLPLALKSFPNIRYFNVVAYFFFKQWKTPKYQVAAVSSEFDYRNVCADRFFSPTMTTPRYTFDPLERLAYVKLNCIQSPEELRMILNLLPNTQYLTLIDGIKALDDNYNITFNLDNLRLKLFHLDLTKLALNNSDKHTIVLQLEEDDIDKKHYFKWKREKKEFTEMIFEPTPKDFLLNHGRFTSENCNIVIIKVKRVEQMLLSFKSDDSPNPVQTTLNFTL